MSVNRFFNEFFSNKATFGFDMFSKDILLNTSIVFEPLKEHKDKNKGFPIFTRKLSAVVPISGVPFCSQSAMTKVFKIIRPKP